MFYIASRQICADISVEAEKLEVESLIKEINTLARRQRRGCIRTQDPARFARLRRAARRHFRSAIRNLNEYPTIVTECQ